MNKFFSSSMVNGKKTLWILLILMIAGTVLFFFWKERRTGKMRLIDLDAITIPVQRDSFVPIVRGRGNVESSVNTDITCKVSGSSTIVDIIPEGSWVEEGDVLARFDSRIADENLLNAIINQQRAENTVIKGRARVRCAWISLEEYVCGTFENEWLKADNNVYNYKQTLKQNRESSFYTQRLVQAGYSGTPQLEIYEANKVNAYNNLQKAILDRMVLLKHTSEKEISNLISILSTQTLQQRFYEMWYKNRTRWLKYYLEQVDFCTVRAPCAGQIVYANQIMRSFRRENEMIQVGSIVVNGQLLFRIPEPGKIQIRTNINESDISRVQHGMQAKISFGMISPKIYEGEVDQVNRYPETIWRSSVKNYIVNIKIKDLDQITRDGLDLRTGISAEVGILLGEMRDVLLVPLDSLVFSGKKSYCLRIKNDIWEYREVRTGPSDSQKIVITEGLNEGDRIVALPELFQNEFPVPDQNEPSVYPDDPENTFVLSDVKLDQTVNDPEKVPILQNESMIKMTEETKKISPEDEKRTFENLKPIQKYFEFSSMEMCQKLDGDQDRMITEEEMKAAAPEFLAFREEWDLNKDHKLDKVEFVLGFHRAKIFYRNYSRLK
ncbi:MAG: efflux RND transporter periplasmic adaptor subunit [Planctomycetia bacterium]|nr:efflux RND transporter periplasmic adaptor subunit [Planctomycetia bacterium]